MKHDSTTSRQPVEETAMVTIKIAALVGILLLAGLCVHRVVYPPQDDVTVSAQMQHKPDIDLGKLGRAFRA
jgi:hypothetical protein